MLESTHLSPRLLICHPHYPVIPALSRDPANHSTLNNPRSNTHPEQLDPGSPAASGMTEMLELTHLSPGLLICHPHYPVIPALSRDPVSHSAREVPHRLAKLSCHITDISTYLAVFSSINEF
ncbi:hypothetical protein IMCC21906_00103 [Spongiibacter sp. IMCC21906]|uniref:hypothetical protein n=1 Tax=Spongiibacter sp. IMCC21906 TaxID=1620392 RepID=UPI00062DD7EB|nr:hypothetical protein [Spongiibacter sp. IMCC21906]AKH67797.1 hypothetical protein IMCC21906_00103 [Spongiibacter sp. IMCC21906]